MKNTSMYLQNRELLEFCEVFALPKASNTGPTFETFSFTHSFDAVVLHKNSTKLVEVLVFPEPDIPYMIIEYFCESYNPFKASFAGKILLYVHVPFIVETLKRLLTYNENMW